MLCSCARPPRALAVEPASHRDDRTGSCCPVLRPPVPRRLCACRRAAGAGPAVRDRRHADGCGKRLAAKRVLRRVSRGKSMGGYLPAHGVGRSHRRRPQLSKFAELAPFFWPWGPRRRGQHAARVARRSRRCWASGASVGRPTERCPSWGVRCRSSQPLMGQQRVPAGRAGCPQHRRKERSRMGPSRGAAC